MGLRNRFFSFCFINRYCNTGITKGFSVYDLSLTKFCCASSLTNHRNIVVGVLIDYGIGMIKLFFLSKPCSLIFNHSISQCGNSVLSKNSVLHRRSFSECHRVGDWKLGSRISLPAWPRGQTARTSWGLHNSRKTLRETAQARCTPLAVQELLRD